MTELGIARGPAVEVREGYTDLVTAGLQARAAGNVARAAATGGLQTAAGIVSRALSTAEADGDMGVFRRASWATWRTTWCGAGSLATC